MVASKEIWRFSQGRTKDEIHTCADQLFRLACHFEQCVRRGLSLSE